MYSITKKQASRFWNKVNLPEYIGTDECWEWMGHLDRHFYGLVSINRRRIPAHRVSYELAMGEIQDGLCVLHRCDNPSCVNPAHLFLGTRTDNSNDKVAKGRQKAPVGEEHYRAILTAPIVIEIRQLYGSGNYSQPELSKMYGVSYQTIWQVVHRKRWQHL